MNCKNQSNKTTDIIQFYGGSALNAPENNNRHARQMQFYVDTMIDLFRGYKLKGTDQWKYCCYEEIVKQHGRYFLPSHVIALVNVDVESRFTTAFNGMRPGVVYCEGYVLLQGENTPVEHAWLYNTKTQKVIDFTWGSRANLYFGIPFSADYASAQTKETGQGGNIFGSDLETANPMLINGVPENALEPVK